MQSNYSAIEIRTYHRVIFYIGYPKMRYIKEQGRQVSPEAGTSTSIQRRTESRFPANQETSPPSLLKLPNEIMYGIMSYLDLPERMLLALTCKSLMPLASSERSLPRLNLPTKRRFLLVLQRDIPKTFLCPCCSKLQRLNPRLNWKYQDHHIRTACLFSAYFPDSMWRNCHSELRKHIIFPNNWQTFMKHGHICFLDAHLIMNRHFYGPLHGISLRHLTRRVSFETELELSRCLDGSLPSDENRRRAKHNTESAEEPTFDWIPEERPRRSGAWRFSLQYSPKIIDDKLYLARSFTLVGPNVPWDHLKRLMNSIKPKICNHMSCKIVTWLVAPEDSSTFPGGHAGKLAFGFSPEIESYWRTCGFSPETGSCSFCMTDYDVSLTQHSLEEEWRFNCKTYHCLGQCRSKADPVWDYFVFAGERRVLLLNFVIRLHKEGRTFTNDGYRLLFGHPSKYGEARRKWLENTTEAETL